MFVQTYTSKTILVALVYVLTIIPVSDHGLKVKAFIHPKYAPPTHLQYGSRAWLRIWSLGSDLIQI